MTNLMQDGSLWLIERAKESGGRSITYCRGSIRVSITAVPKLEETEVIDEDGFGTGAQLDDFLIEASDLVVAGAVTLPRAGDRIEMGSDTFEVVPPSGTEKAFETYDVSGTILEVHTKRIGK
jgi:hypothetical protein